MVRNWCLLFFLLTGLSVKAQPLRVAVAANAQFVMEKLQQEFQQKTGIKIETVVNSSGKLTAQIRQGAPLDIFLSADVSYPETLYKGGFGVEKPKVYAYGTLVLWSMQPINLSGGLKSLINDRIRRIAVANPESAPYGAAAVDALKKAGIYTALQKKLVFGESISQVNQYVKAGAAEVGFTAKSVALEPALKGKGSWVELPKNSYRPIAQSVILLKSARQPALARQFYNFLFSPRAKAIFRAYGYGVN